MSDRRLFQVLVGGALALAAAGPPLRRRAARHLPGPLADALVGGALAGVGWAAIAAAERVRPFRPEWAPRPQDVSVDLSYLAVSSPLQGAVSAALIEALVPDRRHDGRASSLLRAQPLVVQAALAIVVSEAVHYAHHRAAHTYEPLWRFHAIHHSPDRMYWMNAVRFHPVDIFPVVTAQVALVRLLPFDPDAVLMFNIFKGIHGQLQHANVDLDAGAWDLVLSSPAQHRWHHAPTAREDQVNYGSVLSLFDRMFGTQRVTPTTAFTGAIGPGPSAGSIPTGIVAQMLRPFTQDRGRQPAEAAQVQAPAAVVRRG